MVCELHLRNIDLSLDDTIASLLASESSQIQLEKLNGSNAQIDSLAQLQQTHDKAKVNNWKEESCRRCGKIRARRKCFGYGKTCSKCQGKNRNKINAIEPETKSEEENTAQMNYLLARSVQSKQMQANEIVRKLNLSVKFISFMQVRYWRPVQHITITFVSHTMTQRQVTTDQNKDNSLWCMNYTSKRPLPNENSYKGQRSACGHHAKTHKTTPRIEILP